MGRFDCLRYTQMTSDGRRRFWFAKALPGRPIQWEISAGGRVVVFATTISLQPGPTP